MNSVTIKNLTWDASASQRGLERAADKVSKAVERATDKNAKDTANAVNRGVDRITKSAKDNTDRIVAAVGKITNDASQPVRNDRAAALQKGLDDFCNAVEQISEYVRNNPSEDVVGSMKEAIRHLDEGLDDIVQSVEDVNTSGDVIRHNISGIGFALEKSAETLDWVKSRFPVADSTNDELSDFPDTRHDDESPVFHWAGSVNNVFADAEGGTGRVFDSFQSLYNSQNGS